MRAIRKEVSLLLLVDRLVRVPVCMDCLCSQADCMSCLQEGVVQLLLVLAVPLLVVVQCPLVVVVVASCVVVTQCLLAMVVVVSDEPCVVAVQL